MRLSKLTAVAAVALGMAITAPAALSQAAPVCEETQFGAKTGQKYLDAETLLFGVEGEQAPNPQAALAAIAALKASNLNCYEIGAVTSLSAAANVQIKDYAAAVRDLESLISLGVLKGEAKTKTYFQIAQIYLQENDLRKAADYMQKWLADGAKPTKQQYMQLATLYNQLGDNNKAIEYLEALLRVYPNPDKQTIDFIVYLYNQTGQKAKLAKFLSDTVIPRFPQDKKYWEVMASLYYEAEDDGKAFAVTKAMYLNGFFEKENEVMRVVNFYNTFNAPYEAAKILEKEMNAKRINETPEKLETLANLYQVAREYDKAIPVIQKFANATDSGKAYERLGRSLFELKKYGEAEQALRTALQKGGLKEPGFAWILIGQMKHEQEDRKGAREAFGKATKLRGGRGGSGWIAFMNSEDNTAKALAEFGDRVKLDEERNVKKICDQAKVLGGDPPENCAGVEDRILALEYKLNIKVDPATVSEEEAEDA